MSRATPARMSGLLMVIPAKGLLTFQANHNRPVRITQHNPGSHINELVHKNRRLSNIFWCINTDPRAWVAVTSTILSKSGSKARPGMIINGQDGSVEESLDLINILCRNMDIVSTELQLNAQLAEFFRNNAKVLQPAPLIVISLRVMAASPIKRSYFNHIGQHPVFGASEVTNPSMVIRLLPIPLIRAPIALSIRRPTAGYRAHRRHCKCWSFPWP